MSRRLSPLKERQRKIMNKKGKMTIVNPSEDAMDIFDLTGFTNLLNIKS